MGVRAFGGDADLAALYQVDVRALNQAVKRNRSRFPVDFMFRLTDREATTLRSQIVTASFLVLGNCASSLLANAAAIAQDNQ